MLRGSLSSQPINENRKPGSGFPDELIKTLFRAFHCIFFDMFRNLKSITYEGK
jgi:hypothetical protein